MGSRREQEGQSSGDAPEAKRQRKQYQPPRLQAYGSVAKLTRKGNGTGVDGSGSPGMEMNCL
jgi:hypothetical protein